MTTNHPRHAHRPLRVRLLAGALMLAACAPVALAQPGRPAPPPEPRERAVGDRAAQRERLEARLERANELVERLERALAALDAGRDIDDPPAPEDGNARTPRRAGPMDGAGREGGRDLPPPEGMPDRAAVEAFVRANLPELAARLDRLDGASPEAAEGVLRRVTPRVAELLRMPDPQQRELRTREFVLRFRLFELGQAWRGAHQAGDAAEAAALESRASAMIDELYDLGRRSTELEIRAIERRLAELRERLDSPEQSREAFRAQAMRTMTRPGPGEPAEPRRAPPRGRRGPD